MKQLIKYGKLIELYKERQFHFDRLITFCLFEEINKAMEDMERGKVLKAVLHP